MILVVAAGIHFAALLNARPLQSANDRSRWCTVWSLIERGTFQIDEIRQQPGWDSIDIVHVDGHFYSTKPPLLTIFVAGLTKCVTWVTGWNLLDHTWHVTTSVLCLINLVPFIFSLALLASILDRHSNSNWARLFILCTAAFGTLLTPFLMTFNNHTVAAAGTMVAIYALLRLLSYGEARPQPWQFILCGLAAGWTCANELPAAAFGLVAFGLAVRRSIRATVSWFVPAAAIPLIAFVTTNIIATGSWKPTYADYGSSKYRFVIDGVPSYWMNPQGIDRNLDSSWTYFVHCTVGHHGIFSLTPVFVLALLGIILAGRTRDAALKSVVRWGGVLSAIVLGFYLTRTQNYNYGGVSCGLRWSLWLIPFWLIAIVPAIDSLSRTLVARSSFQILLLTSMISAWLTINNPWQHPWLFHRMEEWGWIDYRESPPALPHPLWTWFASLPATQSTNEEPAWIEFTSVRPDGHHSRMKLTCQRTTDKLAAVQIQTIREPSAMPELRSVLIDAEKFELGASPAEFMKWLQAGTTPEQQQRDLTLVRGLPLKQAYHAGVIRYLKTPLRRDAFRCQRAAAQVLYTPDSSQSALRYRCDLWICGELPFGVAQVEFLTTASDGATLHQERWVVSACNPPVSKSAPVYDQR